MPAEPNGNRLIRILSKPFTNKGFDRCRQFLKNRLADSLMGIIFYASFNYVDYQLKTKLIISVYPAGINKVYENDEQKDWFYYQEIICNNRHQPAT